MSDPRPPVRAKASPGPFVAMGAMACLFFLYGASVLFLPWWGVVLLYACWLVLFAVATRWFIPRPRGVLALPAVGLLAWVVAWAVALQR
jgi:hypothetical protein